MAASNLGQLKTSIQNLGYSTDNVAQQLDFINREYQMICGMERWKFLEKQDTSLVTAVGQNIYSIPMTDWRNIDAVRVGVTAQLEGDSMDYMEEQIMRSHVHQDQGVNGTPSGWTLYANSLWLWPAPDKIYNVTFDYIFEPPDLVADSDICVLPQPYVDILVWGAVERMAYRERDWLGRNFAETQKETLLKRMQGEYKLKQRQTGTHVQSSGYWDGYAGAPNPVPNGR